LLPFLELTLSRLPHFFEDGFKRKFSARRWAPAAPAPAVEGNWVLLAEVAVVQNASFRSQCLQSGVQMSITFSRCQEEMSPTFRIVGVVAVEVVFNQPLLSCNSAMHRNLVIIDWSLLKANGYSGPTSLKNRQPLTRNRQGNETVWFKLPSFLGKKHLPRYSGATREDGRLAPFPLGKLPTATPVELALML
jgi:hypothetical protein